LRPHINPGRPRNDDHDVTILSEIGFTNKQWNRRTKELEVPLDQINAYFDEVIQNGWHPSLAGMSRFVRQDAEETEPAEPCPTCGKPWRR
jgi:hypothetical protein